ncbi:trihelix transcription factor ENAP1 [Diospyros lotus]|uniref:trihelix transcription factor ENAP1 n=1 Tax=Diospyros lotus TaxID=55363 RepID=UPI00225635E5|nr:trihelix transcription factor ENAP1 [Diospyros lotus]XP_052170640.1 trihelix transcription factor ENAP1 [Diospyros lotus]
MATPSSSPPPPEQNPDHSSPSSPSPSHSPKLIKRSQPLPWTPQETINLILAYQEKWYSLKRGQLKSSQWEEVAVTVAARCGLDDPSKTATQCRHKIEKLRKRYRAEKLKPNSRASWDYFDHMDRLERGPLPISARPMSVVPCRNQDDDDDIGNNNEDVDDDDYDDEAPYDDAIASGRNKSKSINRIIRGHLTTNKPTKDRKLRHRSDAISRSLQNPVLGKRKERYETEGENDEEEEEEEGDDEEIGGGERETVSQLAAEIKAFAERFVKIENKKIEMMRETERCRLEMESKRMEMILDSQRKIVDSIARAFASHKKIKMSQDI